MTKNEFSFLSSDQKTPIHAVEWIPDGPVRAVLQINHGVAEYILRYDAFASFLADHGFAVVGHDHIGHGTSLAPGAPRLYFGGKGSWMNVVDDIEQRRILASKRFPDVPYFIFGHSMGSFLVRTYLIRYPNKVRGAIIMGTGHMSDLLLSGGKLIAALESLRIGAEHDSPIVSKLSFDSYNKQFAPNRTGFDWLSKNPENVDAYIADPLCGGNASIGLFREMLNGISFIKKKENLSKMNKNLPVLFLSGSLDPVGDSSQGVILACDSFKKAGLRDVDMILYSGLRHEILNETEKEKVYEDILSWLIKKS